MSNLFDIDITQPAREYLALRESAENSKLRKYYEEAWGKFEPYADQQFREEFARHPYQRLWEMYLGIYLLSHNFDLLPHKSHGPDFHIVHENRNIWIEATISSEGIGNDAVPSPFTPDPNRQGKIPEDKIILRYTNSVSEKLKKYKAYLNGIVTTKDAFVVAINGMDIEFERLNASPFRPITKALFGIDQEVVTINSATRKVIERKLTYRDKLVKLSGEEVSTALFLDPQYSGVSGVLYSDADLWNPPQNSGNEFLFIHNYLAENSLEKDWLGHGNYCWLENNQYKIQSAN